MTPGKISKRVAVDRLAWVDRMIVEIKALPIDDKEAFLADNRNVWAAESCLRRALEALFDLGRHILAKGFASGVGEYKEIAERLQQEGILDEQQEGLMIKMAGYRNRMVHFYHEIQAEELYTICSEHLVEVGVIASAFRSWFKDNPEYLDDSL
jgi:uncharacterized protein YutE (UPF0331/DUF86 family)